MVQGLVRGVTVLALIALGLGYGGALHPAGDAMAVLRQPLAVAALLLCFALRPARLAVAGLALVLAALATHTAQRAVPPLANSTPELVLYQQNLLWNRRSSDRWLAQVAEVAPDALTLQEVSRGNLPLLDTLRAQYPAQVVCPFATVGAVAVLSRLPATGREICAEGQGLAALEVLGPGGPVWLVSIHLHWPWPYGQAAQVRALAPVLAGLDGRVAIAGDFNSVGWAASLRAVAEASAALRLGPNTATFHLSRLQVPLGIDHVFSDGAATGFTVLPPLGSDHNGVVARLVWKTPD